MSDFKTSALYAEIMERLRNVDLRSPYYALAASDLRAFNDAYLQADRDREQAQTLVEQLSAGLELEEEKSTILQLQLAAQQSTINELNARIAELEAQLLGSMTQPPAGSETP